MRRAKTELKKLASFSQKRLYLLFVKNLKFRQKDFSHFDKNQHDFLYINLEKIYTFSGLFQTQQQPTFPFILSLTDSN